MLSFDILDLIPKHLKQQALDTLVDFVSEQAKKYASDELAAKIKRLGSDAAFNQGFEEGLERAAQRFIQEYEVVVCLLRPYPHSQHALVTIQSSNWSQAFRRGGK